MENLTSFKKNFEMKKKKIPCQFLNFPLLIWTCGPIGNKANAVKATRFNIWKFFVWCPGNLFKDLPRIFFAKWFEWEKKKKVLNSKILPLSQNLEIKLLVPPPPPPKKTLGPKKKN